MKYHEMNQHINEKTVVINLLQRFYLANVNWMVKKIIKAECWHCKKLNRRLSYPLMGDLPKTRLGFHVPPFTYIIIDIAGPFHIRAYRKPVKRWILVSSCLTTRGIHIEIIESLNVKSALNALFNTFNLRGKPSIIISDNGTNFVGSERKLSEELEIYNANAEKLGRTPYHIEWHFNPAKASYMNGSVERMIGLVKTALNKLLIRMQKDYAEIDDETFRALMCEIIGIVNNRPLSLYPIEGTDNQFLTPNYFLQLRQNVSSELKVTENEIEKIKLKNSWKDAIVLSEILWKHWLKAYVPSIMHREKWLDKKTTPQIGDIVITADPSTPNSWRLAKIIEISEGSQQQVRKVKLLLGRRSSLTKMRFPRGKKRSDEFINELYKAGEHVIITRPASLIIPLTSVNNLL